MKVVLREDNTMLGHGGDVVTVTDGFARNFLFPRGLALKSTPKNIKILAEERKQQTSRAMLEKKRLEEVVNNLEKISITIPVKVGQDEKLYGSVTTSDISLALREEGIEVDRKKIILTEPIRALGIHHISVKLYADISAKLKLWIVKE